MRYLVILTFIAAGASSSVAASNAGRKTVASTLLASSLDAPVSGHLDDSRMISPWNDPYR